MSDLDLLPRSLQAQSRLEREIALPFPIVLDAIDALERQSVLFLGWEALATYPDGGFGAYPGDGVVGLSLQMPQTDRDWSGAVRAAAEQMRRTIIEEATTRSATPVLDGVELIFCITPAATRPPAPVEN